MFGIVHLTLAGRHYWQNCCTAYIKPIISNSIRPSVCIVRVQMKA